MRAEAGLLARLGQAGIGAWLLLGLAGWAVAAWLGAMAGLGGRLAPPVATTPAPLPAIPPRQPDAVGPMSHYASATSRPLFTSDRRPRAFLAVVPDGGDGAQAQPLDFILTGVLISPQVTLAILQPPGGGASQRVRVGSSPEGSNGWRLLEVRARSALFEGPSGPTTLELRTFGVAGRPGGADSGQAAAASDAAELVPEPPMPPPTEAERERIVEIRRRIEARRAQLRRQDNQPAAAAPAPAGISTLPRPVPPPTSPRPAR